MNKVLFYFGCMNVPGHYTWFEGRRVDKNQIMKLLPNINVSLFSHLDAVYTPGTSQIEGVYNESIVPPFRIVAWWDRSLDKRIGSNSALIGVGYDNAEDMLNDAVSFFSEVMKRQKMPIPYK